MAARRVRIRGKTPCVATIAALKRPAAATAKRTPLTTRVQMHGVRLQCKADQADDVRDFLQKPWDQHHFKSLAGWKRFVGRERKLSHGGNRRKVSQLGMVRDPPLKCERPTKRAKREVDVAEVINVEKEVMEEVEAARSSTPLPAGYEGLLNTVIHLRNSASVGVIWQHLPPESQQLIRKELRKLEKSSLYLID